jgi:hypothetical protein
VTLMLTLVLMPMLTLVLMPMLTLVLMPMLTLTLTESGAGARWRYARWKKKK